MEQSIANIEIKAYHLKSKLTVVGDAIKGFLMALMVGLFSSVLFVLFVMTVSNSARADFRQIDYDAVASGTLYLTSPTQNGFDESMLLSSNVEIKVSGLIARTIVTQIFTNQSDDWLEGLYVFPLPENAAIDHLKMIVGDREIEGQIHEKSTAKKIYEDAKKEGKQAALAQQQRPNIFTTAVANIAPGDIVEIQLEYQQTLTYAIENGQGNVSLRYPMTMTPRFNSSIAATVAINNSLGNSALDSVLAQTQASSAVATTKPLYSQNPNLNLTKITVELNSGFPLSNIISSKHDIDITYENLSHATITLSQNEVPANQDFILTWFAEPGNSISTKQFREKVGNDYYHLIMIMPPTDGMEGVQPLTREVIYIIDTSGSMAGESIAQAKNALLLALDQLRSFDYFNVIQFNSVTSKLFGKVKNASTDNIASARHYIESLEVDGGTEMFPAIEAALEDQEDNQRIRQIIFVTDGGVDNESALFELIKNHLGTSRLFTVGIGSAPNSYFMKKAAQFGRGSFTYIAQVEEVQEKMQNLFTKLESPVLSDLKLSLSTIDDAEYWPRTLPDLYLGEPLLITLKTKNKHGNLVLTGKRANNEWVRNIALDAQNDSNGIGVLWARNKIENLMDSVYEGVNEDTVRQQVTATALQHHIVSKYTSLVAVDVTPVRPAGDKLKQSQVPNAVPENMMFGRLAQTATPQYFYFVFGLSLLTITLALMMTQYKFKLFPKPNY